MNVQKITVNNQENGIKHPIDISELEIDGDLYISDENYNALAYFKDGHIATKNFDSSSIEYDNLSNNLKSKINETYNHLVGKRISILGDSIATFAGYIPSRNGAQYPSFGVTDVHDTFWMKLIDFYLMELGINESWAGSGVSGTDDGTKAISKVRLDNLRSNGEPDIILLQIGTNDCSADFGEFEFFKLTNNLEYTVSKFRPAYSYIVEYLLLHYPAAKIVAMSPLYRNPYKWDVQNSYGYTMKDMRDSIKKIADTYMIPFIDMSKCGINIGNYETYLLDLRSNQPTYKVHPGKLGFNVMANFLIQEFKNISTL